MRIIKLDQTSAEWRNARIGKVTGSIVDDVVPNISISKDLIVKELESLKIEFKKSSSKGELLALLDADTISNLKDKVITKAERKMGFYQLIADRLSTGSDSFEDESPMQRGTRLEPEAVEEFSKLTDFVVDRDIGLCVSDNNGNIAYSPDGVIITDYKIETDVEVKCLSSAKHIRAFIEQKIPDEYYGQMLQGFIVNEDLQKRYFVFYDPRIMCKPIHWIEINRKDVQEDIDLYFKAQNILLKEVDEWVTKLSF